MKNYDTSKHTTKRLSALLLLPVILLSTLPGIAPAYQVISGKKALPDSFDHVINRRGESRVSFLTGIPVLGTAEYAYGISDRLTFGVFGGFTPFEEAIGIRVRTVVHQKSELFRVYYCTPIVFYPQATMAVAEPWWLIRPNINFEWLADSGIRYKFGGSVIGAASHRRVFGIAGRENEQLSPELWTAIHGGFSMPAGRRVSFQAELSYITKGVHTIKDFFGGPPVIAIVGFSHTF